MHPHRVLGRAGLRVVLLWALPVPHMHTRKLRVFLLHYCLEISLQSYPIQQDAAQIQDKKLFFFFFPREKSSVSLHIGLMQTQPAAEHA